MKSIRAEGLSRARDLLLPGISAVAAPVFDGQGAIALALTVIGTSAALDTGTNGPAGKALRRVSRALSSQLGAPPAAATA